MGEMSGESPGELPGDDNPRLPSGSIKPRRAEPMQPDRPTRGDDSQGPSGETPVSSGKSVPQGGNGA